MPKMVKDGKQIRFITDEKGSLLGHFDDEDREVAILTAGDSGQIDVVDVGDGTADGLIEDI